LFIAVCAWAVRTGANNFTRYGTIFVIISSASIIINSVLLYDIIDLKNFLPVFTMPLSRYLTGAHIVAALPMCEIIVFFMLYPQMKRPEKFGKALFKGSIIGSITLLIIVARDIAVMGKYTLISTLPTFAVLRLIDIGDILTRLEIVYAVVFIALLFFKVTVIFFAAVSCFSRLVNFKSYKPLVLIFGALIEVYAIAVFESAVEHAAWTGGPAAIYSTFFVFILPALTLIVTVIRNISGKEGQTISGKDEKENQAK
jgi:spore germination protein KB